MAQVHVITGVERRRRWSDDQKRAIVAAAFAPGAVVAAVARRADVSCGLLYRWRRQLSNPPAGFARVLVSPASQEVAAPAAETIEVASRDGSRVRIPTSASPDLAAAIVRALARP